jgi:hypothetical protein
MPFGLSRALRLLAGVRGVQHAAAAGLAMRGCIVVIGDECLHDSQSGIVVVVFDQSTGLTPRSVPSLAISAAGFEERLSRPNLSPNAFAAAAERTGTFDVTVSAAGYHDWQRRAVHVDRVGHCDAISTVHLDARLQPLR